VAEMFRVVRVVETGNVIEFVDTRGCYAGMTADDDEWDQDPRMG